MNETREIKILDCTVRDGGLINDHQFDDEFVGAVYRACVEAGLYAMEIGYKADKRLFSPSQFGAWKYCCEDDIRRIIGDNPTDLKISVMADAERTDYHTDILPRRDSIADIVRVATYIHQIPTALDMVKDAQDKGYETTLNLMAVSTVEEWDLIEALEQMSCSGVNAIYVVDSWGALHGEEIRRLTGRYLSAVRGTGIEVGIHAHNNQMLAYANTVEALMAGADRVDATINGMGRGAGNCPLELLIGYLCGISHQPSGPTTLSSDPDGRDVTKGHELRPILECIRDTFVPLERAGTMEWGYRIPYMITGQLNKHPESAIKMRAGDCPDDCVAFYDEMTGNGKKPASAPAPVQLAA